MKIEAKLGIYPLTKRKKILRLSLLEDEVPDQRLLKLDKDVCL